MTSPLKGKSLLTLLDYSPPEINYILNLAHALKAKKKQGIYQPLLKGKNIALIFEKTSTRTRCAFEVAAFDEGANVTYIDAQTSQIGKKESLEDTAKVLGRFYDAIEFRGFEQKDVETLAEHSGVPVFNGLTDSDHPTQILADLMTIQEHCGKPLGDVKVVFAGDVRNNMAQAWMYACAKLGMKYVGYGPDQLCREIEEKVMQKVYALAEKTGAEISFSQSKASIEGADVIYTDIWASMGEEHLIKQRVETLKEYQVDINMIKAAKNENVLFMHCLPAFHDFETRLAKQWHENGVDIREVTDEVFRSKHSVVFDEAENRMHTIKALMVASVSDRIE